MFDVKSKYYEIIYWSLNTYFYPSVSASFTLRGIIGNRARSAIAGCRYSFFGYAVPFEVTGNDFSAVFGKGQI